MLSRHRICCYMCLPNALLLRGCGCGRHILPTLLFIILAYMNYFYPLNSLTTIAYWIPWWTLNPYILGSNLGNCIIFFIHLFFFLRFFWSLLLQCEFNITVSTQILLLNHYPLGCPGLQRLQCFDLYSGYI